MAVFEYHKSISWSENVDLNIPMSEFIEFEPRLKSAKTDFNCAPA